MGATGAAWGITIMRYGSPQDMVDPSSDVPTNQEGSDNGNNMGPPPFSSLIIVHVAFTVVTLVQLLFLERSIFYARAERYLYKHGMPRSEAGASMSIAPWNRPPLPTYAATLAESGVGTGDVEDNLSQFLSFGSIVFTDTLSSCYPTSTSIRKYQR